jgi:hypothetical protein
MKTLKIDTEINDLTFDGQNNLVMVTDDDEHSQAIQRILTTSTDEYFLNPILGVAYEYLQVKNPNIDRIRAELVKAIMQDSRVKSIVSLDVSFSNATRKLNINFEITMIDGTTINSNEVINI